MAFVISGRKILALPSQIPVRKLQCQMTEFKFKVEINIIFTAQIII